MACANAWPRPPATGKSDQPRCSACTKSCCNACSRGSGLTIADAPSYDSWPSPTWRGIHRRFTEHACMAPISGVVGQPMFYQHQVAQYDSRYTADFAERLPGMDLPVQILWGAEDEWQPLAYAHRLQKDIPGAVLQVVENAGHFLMEDAPAQVSKCVFGFIGRVHKR
ncbi:alpha/beta fold hydrolase [Pseudomonas sp. K2I15]|uniref:alpha/beta fold hydrolase n=1 Tax=unclassified Pseudomonas TaxID=196821 RepID=UPI002113A65D|nr:alpha/beta hydrolase [Pseudomonas sp. K2I15]